MNNYCFDIVDYRLFFLNGGETNSKFVLQNWFYIGSREKGSRFQAYDGHATKARCGAVFVESYSTTTILSSFTTTCDPFFLYSLLEPAQNSVFTSIRSKKINLSIFLAILIHDSKNSIVQLVTWKKKKIHCIYIYREWILNIYHNSTPLYHITNYQSLVLQLHPPNFLLSPFLKKKNETKSKARRRIRKFNEHAIIEYWDTKHPLRKWRNGRGRGGKLENGIPPLLQTSFHVTENGRNGPPGRSPASFTTWKRWQHHPDGESPSTKRKEWWCTYRGARGRGLSRRSLSRQRRWRRPPRRPPCRRGSCSFLDPYFCLPVSTLLFL